MSLYHHLSHCEWAASFPCLPKLLFYQSRAPLSRVHIPKESQSPLLNYLITGSPYQGASGLLLYLGSLY